MEETPHRPKKYHALLQLYIGISFLNFCQMTRGIVYEVDWFGCHVASKEAKVDNVGHCESEGYRTDEDDDALGSADGMPWVVEAQAEDGMSVFFGTVSNPDTKYFPLQDDKLWQQVSEQSSVYAPTQGPS
mmetsp:Transcript_6390/g.13903  ORF Transcript_6390/g.13903 Transcript_6390/m.13903 type:complete len:130 (+) Transcript_6390:570-959(+)